MSAKALLEWVIGMRKDEGGGEDEKMLARITSLRDSLSGLPDEEADAGWRELEKAQVKLKAKLQQPQTSLAFLAETSDLLDDLEGNPVGILFEVGAIYNMGLVGAFARIGAGEDAVTVWEDLQNGHVFNLKPEYWKHVKTRTERYSRWNPPPAPVAEFGSMVELFGWLCGQPAGDMGKKDFWEWLANAIPGWAGDARGEVLWMDEESGKWVLAETPEGMGDETRRKLAIGLAAYCAGAGAAANVEIRMCEQRAYAEEEMAEAEARAFEANAAQLTAEARVAELERREEDKDRALEEAEVNMAEAESKREEAEAARQRAEEMRLRMEGERDVWREVANGKIAVAVHAAAGAHAEVARGRVAAEGARDAAVGTGKDARAAVRAAVAAKDAVRGNKRESIYYPDLLDTFEEWEVEVRNKESGQPFKDAGTVYQYARDTLGRQIGAMGEKKFWKCMGSG